MNNPPIFDVQKIYSEIQKSTDVALYEVGEKIIDDTNALVPMHKVIAYNRRNHEPEGVLRASAEITKKSKKGGIEISYSRPTPVGDVVDNLYEGKNAWGSPVQHWTTPGTGGKWLEKSEEAHLQDWIEYFRQRTREIWRERK